MVADELDDASTRSQCHTIHMFIILIFTYPCAHKCTLPMDLHTYMSGTLVYCDWACENRPLNADFLHLYSIVTILMQLASTSWQPYCHDDVAITTIGWNYLHAYYADTMIRGIFTLEYISHFTSVSSSLVPDLHVL